MNWLDNSKAIALERCPRQYYWRYECNLAEVETPRPSIQHGLCVHAALQAAMSAIGGGASHGEAIEIAITTYKENWSYGLDDDWRGPTSFSLAIGTWWQFIESALNLFGRPALIETRLAVDILPGWQYRCRVDLALESAAGLTLIDYKTTSRSFQVAVKDYEGSPQLLTYAWALGRKENRPIVSAAYIFLVAACRRLQSGAWGNLTINGGIAPVAATPNDVAMAGQRIRQAAMEIDERRHFHDWPLRLSHCQGRYQMCEFHPLCRKVGFKDPTQEHVEHALSSGYILSEWDPFVVE